MPLEMHLPFRVLQTMETIHKWRGKVDYLRILHWAKILLSQYCKQSSKHFFFLSSKFQSNPFNKGFTIGIAKEPLQSNPKVSLATFCCIFVKSLQSLCMVVLPNVTCPFDANLMYKRRDLKDERVLTGFVDFTDVCQCKYCCLCLLIWWQQHLNGGILWCFFNV